MSHNPRIEAIHEARYDLEMCAEKDKPAARAKLYSLFLSPKHRSSAATESGKMEVTVCCSNRAGSRTTSHSVNCGMRFYSIRLGVTKSFSNFFGTHRIPAGTASA